MCVWLPAVLPRRDVHGARRPAAPHQHPECPDPGEVHQAPGHMQGTGRLGHLSLGRHKRGIMSAWHSISPAFFWPSILLVHHFISSSFCRPGILLARHLDGPPFYWPGILLIWHFIDLAFCWSSILSPGILLAQHFIDRSVCLPSILSARQSICQGILLARRFVVRASCRLGVLFACHLLVECSTLKVC